MIQNLFVVKDGIALVNQNFGECHSLTQDIDLITSYISALQMISEEITGSSMRSINFDEITFHFYKDTNKLGLFYILVVDINDNQGDISNKIRKISELFNQLYFQKIEHFNGNISQFENFGEILIEKNIAQINCGENSECVSCSNRNNEGKFIEDFKSDREKHLARFKSA
ncbi:MAG: hypothetical protein ACFFDK_00135 [Promethearchaeota archaeon]